MAITNIPTASTGPQESANGNSAFLFQLIQQMMQSQMGGQQQLDPNIAAIMSGNSDVAKAAIHANDPGRGRLRPSQQTLNTPEYGGTGNALGGQGLNGLYAMNPYAVRGEVDWDGSKTANRAQAAGKLRDSNSALLQGQTNLEQAKVDALMRLLGQGGVPNAQGGVDMPQQNNSFNPANQMGPDGTPFMLQKPEIPSRMAGPGDMPFVGSPQFNMEADVASQTPQQVPFVDIPGMQDWNNGIDWDAVNQIGAPMQQGSALEHMFPGLGQQGQIGQQVQQQQPPANKPLEFAGLLPGLGNMLNDATKLTPPRIQQTFAQPNPGFNWPMTKTKIGLGGAANKAKNFIFGQ